MLDVPALAEDVAEQFGLAAVDRSWEPLCRSLAVDPGDASELVCVGTVRDHLGRRRRCAWHLVLHRRAGGDWTHLYRVLPEHGRTLVLLDRARPGDARDALRHHVLRHVPGHVGRAMPAGRPDAPDDQTRRTPPR